MNYTIAREQAPALAIERIKITRRGAIAEVIVGSRAALADSLERLYTWDDPIVLALRRGRDAAAYLMWIHVKNKGRGAGSELLGVVEDILRKENVLDLYAHAAPEKKRDLDKLLRFYEHNGFESIGTFPYRYAVRRRL